MLRIYILPQINYFLPQPNYVPSMDRPGPALSSHLPTRCPSFRPDLHLPVAIDYYTTANSIHRSESSSLGPSSNQCYHERNQEANTVDEEREKEKKKMVSRASAADDDGNEDAPLPFGAYQRLP